MNDKVVERRDTWKKKKKKKTKTKTKQKTHQK